MKKNIIFLVSFLFLGCNSKKIENNIDFRIVENLDFNYKSNNAIVFKCNNYTNKDGFGKLEIYQKRPNLMKIRCVYNMGYGGEVIEMEIDNKSKINYISYKYNDDTVGEANEVYEITSSKIILNKNPLIQNQNNFKGAIELKGVVELKSVNMFEFSKKEKFHFKGYMICE